ncbi:MAG TPA: HNH endonuclease [Firmicutes bacterium]|nr:HNH endonuclease [Bacillota bacterium]
MPKPNRPLRPCAHVGCAALVRPPERYCPAHRWMEEQREAHRQRYYDQHLRNREAKAFYNSQEWQRLRQYVLNRDKHLCVLCLAEKKITPAEHVDHIVPISQDWSRRLDPENCRSLCAVCHNRVRAEQARG